MKKNAATPEDVSKNVRHLESLVVPVPEGRNAGRRAGADGSQRDPRRRSPGRRRRSGCADRWSLPLKSTVASIACPGTARDGGFWCTLGSTAVIVAGGRGRTPFGCDSCVRPGSRQAGTPRPRCPDLVAPTSLPRPRCPDLVAPTSLPPTSLPPTSLPPTSLPPTSLHGHF